MELHTLYIDVKVYGGSRIDIVCLELVAMARHLRISVWAEFNGVRVLARPNDNPDEILEAYNDAVENHQSHAATGVRQGLTP